MILQIGNQSQRRASFQQNEVFMDWEEGGIGMRQSSFN
jgi:hypothetical protein